MSQLIVGSTVIGESNYPFYYNQETEKITILLGARPIIVSDEMDKLIGQGFGALLGGNILYKLSVPLSNDCQFVDSKGIENISFGNQIRSVEYLIENYQENSSYSEMRLRFPELNYFIPSESMATVLEKGILFSDKKNLYSFDIEYCNTMVSVSFDIKVRGNLNVKATVETLSEVSFKFPETKDLEYLIGLYFSARAFFSFVCNRQNIGLRSAILIGKYPKKTIKDDKIVNVDGYTKQKLVLSQKYLEPLENEKTIAKVPNGRLFSSKVKELFQLFFEENIGDGVMIDDCSIHPSFKYRALIDLEQSLHITAVFEYYVRTMLPEISSTATTEFLNDLEGVIDEYIKNSTGKKKRKAKNFKKILKPQISLEEKIMKSYEGYSTWQSLKPIISEWFGNEVSSLARIASLWRNELAHEKREYQPNADVVTAVRLVEHINYCIVLRHAGYDDEEIKSILADTLTR